MTADGIFALLVLSLVGVTGVPTSKDCPPEMVWGGTKCEWRNVCPDGSPYNGKPCAQVKTPPRAPTPQPVPPLPPTAAPQPVLPVPGSSQCAGGEIAINGKCVRAPRDCDRATVFFGEISEPARNVLLVNGPAPELIDRYFSDLRKKHSAGDVNVLTVFFYEKGELSTVRAKQTMVDFFKTWTIEQVWEKRVLKGRNASDVDDPISISKNLMADLICGSRGTLPR